MIKQQITHKINSENNLKNTKCKMMVGWFAGQRYDDNTSVAEVASQNEFGSKKKHIPPRPFMRPTAQTEKNKWRNVFAELYKKNNGDLEKTMNGLGLVVSGAIKKTISEIWDPPLAEKTINARKARKDKHSASLNDDLSNFLTTIKARKDKYKARKDKYSDGGMSGSSIEKPLVDTGLMISSVSHRVINDD